MNSKCPQKSIDNIEPTAVHEMVTSLKQLYDLGKPQTDLEVESRIEQYFSLCQRTSLRLGIESLCMALHISRTTLLYWSRGEGCSEVRQELIQAAQSFVGAFIEQAVLSGKISPPSGIFLMKNWLGYKDSIGLEENMPRVGRRRLLTAEDLPQLGDLNK